MESKIIKMNKIFNKLNITRIALLLGASIIILLLLPHADRKQYNYELHQPWKYPLLTAEFDIPIMRDSVSASALRDSIDANFIPFVVSDKKTVRQALTHFKNATSGKISSSEMALLAKYIGMVYDRGIVESKLYEKIQKLSPRRVRMTQQESGVQTVQVVGASRMMSPSKAYNEIDSLYSASISKPKGSLPNDAKRALNVCLLPNVHLDEAADAKYRNQEYLAVNGAQGVIKKGQRIVDRGEIVTGQILTNLNTYTEMLMKQTDDNHSHSYFLFGHMLYILLSFSLLYLFLSSFRPRFFNDMRQMIFLMSTITIFVVFSIVMSEFLANGIYLIPFAMVPVVILIFFDSRTAIFAALVTIMLAALVAVFQFQFIFMELVVSVIAALSLKQLSRRSQLLRVAIISFALYCLIYFTMRLIADGNLSQFAWRMIGIFAINAVALSFAYVFILIIERIFGFTSIVTLVELSDINSPLLRRLAQEAPGTFQHSMQVSMLASEAAREIGANTQLVRTGALYHDIGKLESPVFFTENQHGINPHDGLNPEVSAQKIISHVTAGQALALKEKLPAVIRNFIVEHHGRSMAKYFYNTAVNQSPDGVVDCRPYTYPGPNPRSKETAILMMADSVEAASRSLKDYSQESINNLVDKIIDTQIGDGLFQNSPISFSDVEKVKNTFKSRLATIYHARIVYPEIKKHVVSEVN